MKISLEGAAQVRCVPETKEEREGLNTLHRVLVQGRERNVLAPVGEFGRNDDGAIFWVQAAETSSDR